MTKVSFADIVKTDKGLLRGPFGGDLKKEIFVDKSDTTYKVYEQGVVLRRNQEIGRYNITKEYFDKKMNRFEVLPKDFLVSCSGANYGAIFQLGEKVEQGVINQALLRIRLDNSVIDDNYFFYLFNSFIVNMIVGRKGDSTIPNFPPLSVIKKLEFDLPKLNYQKLVGRTLIQIDKKIELNNKINAELEAMAKLIYDYWFVQFDFPDTNGKPYKSSGGKMVYKEELNHEIPESWDVYALSSILRSNYSSIGKIDCFDAIEYLDTGSLTKNLIEGTELICTEKDKVPSRAKRIVHKNDILYSTVRPNLCHYGIIKDPVENMVASTGFAQLSSRIDWISNDLVYTFLTSTWVTKRLHQIAALAVSAYPSISNKDILELNIALPKKGSLMANANEQFSQIYTKISVNHKENKQLSELRDWLLPMLMNGQVTVKE